MPVAESEVIAWPGGLRPEQLPSLQRGSKGVNVGRAERWVSALAGLGLVGVGLVRGRPLGWALAAVGGSLIHRGLVGHSRLYAALGISTAVPGPRGVLVQQRITVLTDRQQLYRAWRQLDSLPRFLSHVEAVQLLGEGRSRWRVRGPLGRSVEWVAVLTEEREGEALSWSTLRGSSVSHVGTVRFSDAPVGRGTEMEVTLHYRARGGRAGVVLARLLGEEPKRQLADDLRRFKQLMEAGEIATVTPQPSGRRSPLGRALSPNR